MFLSLFLIILAGLLSRSLLEKHGIPPLTGMILAGILLGPSVCNLLDASLLAISAEIRKTALLIILIRAGLKLDLSDLKKAGRPVLLFSFVPACFEILGTVLLGPIILHLSVAESALLGSVIAAVSPAVVVPRMIRLIDEGYGTEKAVPQMILAGASLDDVFVIVLFSSFLSLVQGDAVSILQFARIPLSIASGIALGALTGILFGKYRSASSTANPLLLIALAFLFTALEDLFPFPFSSLISVMVSAMFIRRQNKEAALKLIRVFDGIWNPAEIFLFVLLGASVNVGYALQSGMLASVLLILSVLLFRMVGVSVCIIGTPLNAKEKLFCFLAYIPKATVQAAIGGVPLAMGLACGETILSISVMAILISAPLGALAIDQSYKKLLSKALY